jgi:hypothetical protein
MAEYRPEPTELWQTIRRNLPLVRRIALALGGLMLGYVLGRTLSGNDVVVGCAAVGAAIIGFFAPAWKRGPGQDPPDTEA